MACIQSLQLRAFGSLNAIDHSVLVSNYDNYRNIEFGCHSCTCMTVKSNLLFNTEVVIISNTTSLYVGDTILLTCVGFGQLQPDVEITWSKNGADIMNSSSTIIYEEEIAEGGRTFKVSTLVLCGLQGSGAGSYNCTVRNNQTTMTATTQLSVPGIGYIIMYIFHP